MAATVHPMGVHTLYTGCSTNLRQTWRAFHLPRDHQANLIHRLHSPIVHHYTGMVSRGLVNEGINWYELTLAFLRSSNRG